MYILDMSDYVYDFSGRIHKKLLTRVLKGIRDTDKGERKLHQYFPSFHPRADSGKLPLVALFIQGAQGPGHTKQVS